MKNSPRNKIPKNRLWFWIASGFGVGLFPLAPGTIGSLWGVLLAYPVQFLAGFSFWLGYVASLVVLFWLGLATSGRLCRFLGIKDPPVVIIDEITGQFMVTALVARTFWSILASFVLFRFFDICKFAPCKRAERLPAGWGVMSDDVIAGAYSLIAYHVIGAVVRAIQG